MTNERAIEILDPEHREHYDGLDEVNEACRLGMDALRERIERRNGGWISVEDTPPVVGALVCDTEGQVYIADEITTLTLKGGKTVYIHGWIMGSLGSTVPSNCTHITHWMPLPKPPEQEDKSC